MEETKKINLIKTNPKKAINKLSIPSMFALFLSSSFILIDTIWISGLGTDSLAAAGIVAPLFSILMALGDGMGIASTSFISRSIGKENKQLSENGIIHIIIITIILSIIIPIIMTLFLKLTLNYTTPTNYISESIKYATPLFIFAFIFFFEDILIGMMEAEGNMNKITLTIVIGVLINLILDPIFIYVLNMGISGAAWTSIISSFISCLMFLYWILIKKNTYATFNKKSFIPSKKIVFDLFKVAIPSTIEFFAISLITIILNILILTVSTEESLAIFTSGIRLIQFFTIPCMGIATVIITITGTSYGAENLENIKIGFKYGLKLSYILTIIFSIIIFIFAEQIAFLFCYSPEMNSLIPQLTLFLRIFILYIIPLPIGHMTISVLNGAGKGTQSLIITLIQSILFELVFAILFGYYLNQGIIGIYIGLIFGSFLGGILTYICIKLFMNRTRKEFYYKRLFNNSKN